MMIPWLSIIVPVLNEAANINGLISSIRGVTTEPGLVEIIVVDGGSQDESVVLSAGADQVLFSEPGRSLQMNVGARHSRGEVLLFLHADTYLPDMAIDHIKNRRWRHILRMLPGLWSCCLSVLAQQGHGETGSRRIT